MQEFTGVGYLKIDIANHFGLDKLQWLERISWVNMRINELEDYIAEAANPIRFLKAVQALRDTEIGIPSGHLMGLDSTASGIQIMACLMGCETTAKNVNLIGTGNREDIYQKVTDTMNAITGMKTSRKEIKYPVMTVFYGSKAQPENIFGKDTPQLEAFYTTLDEELPGALECMKGIQSCWQPNALEHRWKLPDGHTSIVKVMEHVDKRIEIDELEHSSFTHRAYVNKGTNTGLSLAANVIQSIDGYVVREMIRKCSQDGFTLLTVHDDFMAHPNYMNKVRENYKNILADIAEMDLLGDILSDITGESIAVKKFSNNLGYFIKKSQYALS